LTIEYEFAPRESSQGELGRAVDVGQAASVTKKAEKSAGLLLPVKKRIMKNIRRKRGEKPRPRSPNQDEKGSTSVDDLHREMETAMRRRARKTESAQITWVYYS
jgi:hypothetical protein